jgi:hypothetical protein
VQFNPEALQEAYLELPTDELVRIAFLSNDYVPEAKKLAQEELARRDFHVDDQTIEKVRARLKRRRADFIAMGVPRPEVEGGIPDRSAQRSNNRLQMACAIVGILLLIASLNFYGELGWFGSKARVVLTVSKVIALLTLVACFRLWKDEYS